MEHRDWKNSLQETAGRHASRRGAFSAGLTALAVAAVLVFNLLAAQLPEQWAQIDLTGSGIYNISETSQDYLAGLEDDVVIHVLTNKDTLDTRIVRFLDIYTDLSDHLSLEYTDPTVYPSVLSEYGVEADTIVVTCEATGRQESFSIDDIIGYDIMSYYYYGSYNETDFDGEGLLTSAVDGVLTDASRTICQTTGHDEAALSSTVETLLSKSHISVSSVNLLTDHSIPEDCDLLLINDPTRDLAADELEDILEYLAAGGQVIYNMAGEDLSLPNLETLCATYGMDVAPGLIADTQRYYQNNPYWFFPLVDNSVDSASGISNDATLLFCASRGFTLTDPARESITVKSFLTTSEEGMAVTGDSAKDQTPGTYVVAATATEEIDDGITGRLTVFGSDSLINDAINSTFTNLDNLTLFTSAVTVDFDGISSLSIEPVSLETPTNTISTGGIWALLLIFLIPGALLIYGFIRWLRRQKL